MGLQMALRVEYSTSKHDTLDCSGERGEYFTRVCTLRTVLILDGMEVPRLALVLLVLTSTTRNLQSGGGGKKGGDIMQQQKKKYDDGGCNTPNTAARIK